MIPDFEKIKRTSKELQVACAGFKEQHPTLTTISDSAIQDFLNHAAGIDCSESTKLISFAGYVFDDIGWDEYCKIYEYMLANLDGSYVTWIPAGFQLMSDDKRDLDYRIHIADDVHKIIIRHSDGNDSDPSDADLWGEALSQILADRDPRVEGRGRAEQYSATAMAARLLNAWRSVL